MPTTFWMLFPLSCLTVAVVLDIRFRRLPNWLTLPMALAGLSAAACRGGWGAFVESLGGFAFLLLLGFLAWSFGFAGGGDGKLAAGVGAWLGFSHSYPFLLLWVGFNAIATLYVTLKPHNWSLRAWWAEQRVGVQALKLGHISKHGVRSYPGAVTLTLAYVFFLIIGQMDLALAAPH